MPNLMFQPGVGLGMGIIGAIFVLRIARE